MIFDAYFIYSIASTVLIAVIAYLLGKSDGHAEGIKKGSRAISNVNKTLDELLMNIADERKEDFTTPAVPSGKGSEISELPISEDEKALFEHMEKAIAKEEKKTKAKAKTPAPMKPKRKKGKK